MIKNFNKLAFVISSSLLLSMSLSYANNNSDVLYIRGATGDLTQLGGATRLKADQSNALKDAIKTNKVKNVILLIGDGMGDSEITAARNYAKGAGGYFEGLDALPFTGSYTHYSLDKKTNKPNYVTDSAASATAWATGIKSYNGAISVDINEKPYKTLLEFAKNAGKSTGNISTAEIQDATPAAQYSHVPNRKCYGPNATSQLCPAMALENGGLGSITEQLINTRADLTLGGGYKTFLEMPKAGKWQGKTLEEQAIAKGYQIVKTLDELNNLTLAEQSKPVLGLFSNGNMPIRWKGPQATLHGAINDAVVSCEINSERNKNIPTLAQMTEKGIELLKNNPNGFFLQVEGASIDKQAHNANPCGQFGETVDLDEAVQVALKFAKENDDTLVIVTADHAHATQIIPSKAKAYGLNQTLMTEDGSLMTINYATSETDSQNHTGTQIRIAGYGPNAANVAGLLDQTDLFFIIMNAMGVESKD
ncbi:alkaline phosphatase [Orbus wheelerorum]|uniref:alkaline phosphatase n=1 Tax=Orbus wheelerorum TaxID=3074111 RepID=UPI00370D7380